jgi:hypothetical protein
MGAMIANARGQANLTAILALIGLIVAAVWGWKRLSPDTQDYVIERGVPAALAIAVVAMCRHAALERVRAYRPLWLVLLFGAAAPVALVAVRAWASNRSAVYGARGAERELLGALREHGELTPRGGDAHPPYGH